MPERWRAGRLAGLMAALVLGSGLGGLAGPAAASAAGAGCPAWDGTQPPGGGLGAIAVTGPCDVWMVGLRNDAQDGIDQTLIVHWTGGSSWTVVPSPNGARPSGGSNGLFGVAAISPTSMWAVGHQAVPTDAVTEGLVTHWDGTSWTKVAVPDGTPDLNSVAAVSASDLWAAGADTGGGDPVLLHYDGTRWSRVPAPGITPAPGPGQTRRSTISGLAFASASDGWAVGDVNISSQPSQERLFPLILHWDGTAWSQWNQQPALPDGQRLLAVSASAPDDAWAVGDSAAGTPVLHWDGHTWTPVPVPVTDGTLGGVADFSPHSAVAVGTAGTFSSGLRNLVLRWDGQAWTRVPSPDKGTVFNGLMGVAAGPAGLWTSGQSLSRSDTALHSAVGVFATVPDMTGQPRAAAIDALNTAGLTSTVTEVTTAGGGCTPATSGTIIATSPAAGTFTAPPVTLTLCSLPGSQTVPNVVNDTDAAARTALTEAGLTTGTVTSIANCDAPRSTVLSQNPTADTTAAPGTPVSLTESTGRAAGGRPCL
jgi:PASTA domain